MEQLHTLKLAFQKRIIFIGMLKSIIKFLISFIQICIQEIKLRSQIKILESHFQTMNFYALCIQIENFKACFFGCEI